MNKLSLAVGAGLAALLAVPALAQPAPPLPPAPPEAAAGQTMTDDRPQASDKPMDMPEETPEARERAKREGSMKKPPEAGEPRPPQA